MTKRRVGRVEGESMTRLVRSTSRLPLLLTVLLVVLLGLPSAGAQDLSSCSECTCAGDGDGDGSVSIAEVVTVDLGVEFY